VIGPLLTRVGDEWQQGGSGIAREHLLSSATRHILGSLLRLQTRRHVPARLVFATLAGDRHEIGTLGAALLAANSGLGVTYLGPDLPAAELISSATRAGVRAVVLGLTTAPAERATVRELRAIVAGLPAGVEVWAGGRGAVRTSSLVGGKVLILHDYFQYQQQLVRLGGQDT
jgi:methanogenic corrinoid protein MtbC1